MIDRYSTKEMRDIWSLKHKFEYWRLIEVYACEYWNKVDYISDVDLSEIREKSTFSVGRILEIEAEIHHDVIAFLTNLAENVGQTSRFIHFGLTSSDVVDTALSCIIQDAGKLIFKRFEKFIQTLYNVAHKYKDIPIVGRTHGVHAEPTTLGLKFLGYLTESKRNYMRLRTALEECAFGNISGAVGTYSQIPMELEEYVLNKLNLSIEPVSTQVIPRDRHAILLNAISLASQGLARLAQEVRLLQKSESREIEEPFQIGQKGSSAMPHKRNPILCERMCGLARVLLGYAQTAQQNIALWHERDISHSSAERIILPDATSLFEYMLIKMEFVIAELHVYEDNCQKGINTTKGLIFSSCALLMITDELGVTREEAYCIVQEQAMKIWNENSSLGLRDSLEKHPKLHNITSEKWDKVFSVDDFLTSVDKIFDRVNIDEIKN